MRVKVGSQWFDVAPGQPIMVELKPGDKENIAKMPPEATRYAPFDDADRMSRMEMLAWMDEGQMK